MRTKCLSCILAILPMLFARGNLHAVPSARKAKLPSVTNAIRHYHLRPVTSYKIPGIGELAVHPSGAYAAYAESTGDGRTTIFTMPMKGHAGKLQKLADFPADIAMAVDAMCWSRSGRYLAICGDGKVGVIDCTPKKPIIRVFSAIWIHAAFFSDEKALLGEGMNASRIDKEKLYGEELQEIDLSADHPTVHPIQNAPLIDVDKIPPFVARDDNTISVVGTKLRVRSDGSFSVGSPWGDDSIYGITSGPYSFGGKSCIVSVSQRAEAFGPHDNMLVVETEIRINGLDGQPIATIDWPKGDRIDSVALRPNGVLFVQLMRENKTPFSRVREYRLVPSAGTK